MSLTLARELDAADPLRRFRDEFVLEPGGPIYLDGNSLGRLPRRTQALAAAVVNEQWGHRLIRGWNEGWLELSARVAAKIARLIGAAPDEVAVCDSTSVNLFKLATAALEAQAPRREILSDRANFPSDAYVLARCGALRLVDDPLAATGPETALVSLTHTDFRTAQTWPLAAATARIQSQGAWALWDLSHSAGALPLDLHAANAELAVGCTYKYLNGGPGAPAYLYVRRDIQERLRSPIQGWFGHARPFEFGLDYAPAPGVLRFLAGTPPVLSTACIEPGVDLLLEAGIDALHAKSSQLSQFLIDLAARELTPFGVTIATPRDPAHRGSHVSLQHPAAWPLTQALIDAGVIPDFRAPDLIRFGLAPLYNTFEEVAEAVARLRVILASESFRRYPAERSAVT